jgi:hypothetical protein
MPLINLVGTLIVVGVLLWLVNSFIPMDRKIKSILNIVVVIVVVIWLLQLFGILGSLDNIRIGHRNMPEVINVATSHAPDELRQSKLLVANS